MYGKFWDMLQTNINKVEQFVDLCKQILAERKEVEHHISAVFDISESLAKIVELKMFYNECVIFHPNVDTASISIAKVR